MENSKIKFRKILLKPNPIEHGEKNIVLINIELGIYLLIRKCIQKRVTDRPIIIELEKIIIYGPI